MNPQDLERLYRAGVTRRPGEPDMRVPLEFYRAVYCAALSGLLSSESHRENHTDVPLYSDEELCHRAAWIAHLSALRTDLSDPLPYPQP